jgi:glycosyltransferase involved in cell wall biosynthesis
VTVATAPEPAAGRRASARRAAAVHQVVPSLHVADASGSHTLHVRAALRRAGMTSEVFTEHVDEALSTEAHPLDALDAHVVPGATVLVYQLAVGSSVVDVLLRRPEPLVVNYHNLTPASFFWQWAPDWLHAVEWGRQQLHRLVPRTEHAVAVSAFNERDLGAAGYRSTAVVPPFVDLQAFGPPRRPPGRDAARGGRWLFVGTLLPHKGAHDVVKALACYRRAYDRSATLSLVGAHPIPAYARAVVEYAASLGLEGAVELTGRVTHDELASRYRAADVLVCLSDHEGFCFPLLEAMHHAVPVVALDAGAVADTVGDAALVLADKEPARVASAVWRVLSDDALRSRLVAQGRARTAMFDPGATAERFVAEIDMVAARCLGRRR